MKLKSKVYYWLAVIFGGIGMGAGLGAEGTAQTTGEIPGTLFAVALILILTAVLLMRLGFAPKPAIKQQGTVVTARSSAPTPATRNTRRIRSAGHEL